MARAWWWFLPMLLVAANGQAADVARGKEAARKCVACHDLTPLKKNKSGPYLWGIFGKPAGVVPGYAFSPAHLAHATAIVWDEKNLDAYLADPRGFIPGNKMAFTGITDPVERADLIAHLKRLQ